MRNSTLRLGETGRPVEGIVISAEDENQRLREQERECPVGRLETRSVGGPTSNLFA
jgi:hypothetical protein